MRFFFKTKPSTTAPQPGDILRATPSTPQALPKHSPQHHPSTTQQHPQHPAAPPSSQVENCEAPPRNIAQSFAKNLFLIIYTKKLHFQSLISIFVV